MADLNLIESYDYKLPEELIAQTPAAQRDQSRLMVFQPETGETEHRHFYEILEFLKAEDCLVLNQTKVVPARLRGIRDQTGGRWEGLFLQLSKDESGAETWEILSKTRGKLMPGERVTVFPDCEQTEHPQSRTDGVQIEFLKRGEKGRWTVRPVKESSSEESVWELLERIGSVPIPPYIRHGEANSEDTQRYQSVYAQTPGATAAPTAGLHFSEELIEKCREKGVQITFVTLHVGLGTFRPVSVKNLDDHDMHSEWCEVTAETVEVIQNAVQKGGRVFAVGTTTVRTLETAANSGKLQPFSGETNLFIRPGFEFNVVQGLITNYHLPQSTLLVMLSAFAGYDEVMRAYQTAIEEKYRFYSYGDAMLLLPRE